MADKFAPAAGGPAKRRLSIPKWLWDAERRPDHSREGFDAAFQTAIDFCAEYEFASITQMQDEMFLIMSERLRTPEIEIEFVAWHYSTGRPRMSVRAGRHTARQDIAVRFTTQDKPKRVN